MIECPVCKKMLDSGVRFCPHDGTPLQETKAGPGGNTPSIAAKLATSELSLPVVVGERYRLEEKRGGGGMAKVYRATDLTLEREVAVKLINPELRSEAEFDARFQREAKIVSKLSDPHVVAVHDFGIDQAHGPYLVMEYLKGQSLRERLRAEGTFPFRAALQIAGQILLALIHAHDKGIIHRDIKPENIFLANQSGVRLHVRLVDFGIAKIFTHDDGEVLTNPGSVPGTPKYMAPEQLNGDEVDVRADLYSAALVIHEIITGKPPSSGPSIAEVCPEADDMLQSILDECLKMNPAHRPDNAVEVYLRLQELGRASGVLLLPPGSMDALLAARRSQAEETTMPYHGGTGSSGRIWLWLLLTLLFGLLGIGLWWMIK